MQSLDQDVLCTLSSFLHETFNYASCVMHLVLCACITNQNSLY